MDLFDRIEGGSCDVVDGDECIDVSICGIVGVQVCSSIPNLFVSIVNVHWSSAIEGSIGCVTGGVGKAHGPGDGYTELG